MLVLYTIAKSACTDWRRKFARRLAGCSDWDTSNERITHYYGPTDSGLTFLNNMGLDMTNALMQRRPAMAAWPHVVIKRLHTIRRSKGVPLWRKHSAALHASPSLVGKVVALPAERQGSLPVQLGL